MAARALNFAAGPGALPLAVLERAQAELLAYGGAGVSVLEMSHRAKEFETILGRTTAAIRTLLAVPANYRVLYFQGGGTLQFACIPMNLLGHVDAPADYVVTGAWSEKAAAEASKYSKNIRVVADGKTERGYTRIPPVAEWTLNPDAKYVFYCPNETIHGVEFDFVPDTKGVPLVADMSSNILSRPLDVSKFAVIFAGAQKNMGPAGVTIVIVRDDLLAARKSSLGTAGHALPITPTVCNYAVMAENDSLYNTAPTYSIYLTGLVMDWVLAEGGVDAMNTRSDTKARMVYGAIDASAGFYWCPVDVTARSRMNVPFRIRRHGAPDETLEKQFLAGADARRMLQLKGHRLTGGIRASLYNAVTVDAVEALVAYMREFQRAHTVGQPA